MSRQYSIVIAEDHRILREGLKALLSSESELFVAGEAEDGKEAIKLVSSINPDIILMDLSMPKVHGLEAIREIRKISPSTKILVLTVHNDDEYISTTLQAGAHGYVLKQASFDELLISIKTVLRGKPYLSPAISETIITGYLHGKKSSEVKSAYDTLTARERETLKLIAEGARNKDIADFMGISVKTAEKHRSNLMKKLNLHSVSAITAFAAKKGLICD
jgi:DNA-binding NarL/FixJ family response regulator